MQPFSFINQAGRGSNSLQVVNQQLLSDAREARKQGFSENDIDSFVSEQQEQERRRAQQARAALVASQGSGESESRNGFLDFALPALGGALGVGGVALAPFTGGASLGLTALGGAIGAGGGRVLSNQLQGKKLLDKEVGTEAALGTLGSAGKVLKFAKGARAAKAVAGGADDAARLAGGGDDAARALGIIDDIGKTDPSDLGRVSRVGKRLQVKAGGLDDARSFDTATKQFGAADVVKDAGLKGSARKKFETIDGTIKNISKQTDDILKKNKNVTDITGVNNNIIKKASAEIVSDRSTFDRSLKEGLSELSKLGGKNGQVTARQLNTFKQKLGGRLNLAFKKLRTGSDLTPEQAANMSIWRAIDDDIVRLAPEAKKLTKTQSILIDSIPGLAKKSKNGISPPLINGIKFESPSQFISSAQDKLGRGLDFVGGGAGSTGSTATNEVLKNLVAQGGVRALFGGGGVQPSDVQASDELGEFFGEQQQFAPGVLDALGDNSVIDPELGALTKPQFAQGMNAAGLTPEVLQQSIPREAIVQAMVEDFSATGGENIGNLITFFEFANQMGDFKAEGAAGGTPELSADQKKSVSQADTALSQVDQLEALFANVSQSSNEGLQNIVGGIPGVNSVRRIADVDFRKYDDFAKGSISRLVRAMGDVGNLAEGEQARALGLVPTSQDSPQAAANKFAELRSMFTQSRARALQGEGQFTQSAEPDILSGLAAIGL